MRTVREAEVIKAVGEAFRERCVTLGQEDEFMRVFKTAESVWRHSEGDTAYNKGAIVSLFRPYLEEQCAKNYYGNDILAVYDRMSDRYLENEKTKNIYHLTADEYQGLGVEENGLLLAQVGDKSLYMSEGRYYECAGKGTAHEYFVMLSEEMAKEEIYQFDKSGYEYTCTEAGAAFLAEATREVERNSQSIEEALVDTGVIVISEEQYNAAQLENKNLLASVNYSSDYVVRDTEMHESKNGFKVNDNTTYNVYAKQAMTFHDGAKENVYYAVSDVKAEKFISEYVNQLYNQQGAKFAPLTVTLSKRGMEYLSPADQKDYLAINAPSNTDKNR